MRFSILASGSSGNAILVETDQTKILVDAGLSGKQMEAQLREVNVDPKSLDAILVTHEHSDHIKGVGVLARRYDLPVYSHEKTWAELDRLIGEIPESQKFLYEEGEVKHFADLEIESFGISHDAAFPMGFCFYQGEKKLTLATDLGYVSQRIKEKVKGSQAYIFESNHDVEMLRIGHYPWNVKRRILSDVGHLSNEDSGLALSEILNGSGEKVYLSHLSKDNNMTELARLTVKNILEENGFVVEKDVKLLDTSPTKPTPIDEI
ncbi:MBL fold metallo-hydrolase [Ammoniphilus resinae]|uniref:Phosphoribosyl 1,2-cyclic phosphodiesterase n=1 Tax=Ammoniphilus resinae TaxID=861532 RepID=A0ABS4GQY8_9BACL|nr:MBL fold metallo-hydrolase [Ammoniphilus resinae]MBP1932305.1 phosphoribosyl 1,2-cyclic phosphodiesterase [Ammoniphilus resinae]